MISTGEILSECGKATPVCDMLGNFALYARIIVLLWAAAPLLYAESTSSIIAIKSATTDGTASESVFNISLTAEALPLALTTSSELTLTLSITPQASDLSLAANVYAVIFAEDRFFKLDSDGGYTPWDGAVETLIPFVTNHTLTTTNQFTLLDGSFAESGSFLYFAAYGVVGETRLLFTPDPAQIDIAESAPLLGDSAEAKRFADEVETEIVQAKCILCHVEGGLARNSSLIFQRSAPISAKNNFATLSAFAKKEGSELLLAKASGSIPHTGGTQLIPGSEEYAAFHRILGEIQELKDKKYYAFSESAIVPSSREASFLTAVALESRSATLRRATLLTQGRIPTEEERDSVHSDETLRIALRRLLTGKAFRDFVVTSVNDRLLTKGARNPINLSYNHFLKLHNRKAEEDRADMFTDLRPLIIKDIKRASGELVSYVIENELPYSEILTAEYTMMNSRLNTWLEGSADFSNQDENDTYKPSVIQGYYYSKDLRRTDYYPNQNSLFEAVGSPLVDFPHAGLLTDFGFLSRYPTTATNRNRARARWAIFHFLGIDIEKSSERPTDEASLSDRNNPTMNNPNCTVCHSVLDPVAGAFQNWDENNFYRGSGDGSDALDSFYKYPNGDEPTKYRQGDLWYRDMRRPGLFDSVILEQDKTLHSLAELIVDEPLFRTAAARFWWPSIFGKPLLDKPTIENDSGYSDKLTAYQAQQEAIEGFASALNQNMNAKDMLVEMFMSPWFSSEVVSSYLFSGAHQESRLGSEQLLSPEQIARKTLALTGVSWRTYLRPSGRVSSPFNRLGVLLGGIDSDVVTERAIELTPTMTSIFMTAAIESSCIAVARQFARPASDRSLLNLVEVVTLPLIDLYSSQPVFSESFGDWEKIQISPEVQPGNKNIELEFLNPYCDYDGSRCVEQRKLYIDSFKITTPAGGVRKILATDPNLTYEGCQIHYTNLLCYHGSVNFSFLAAEPGVYSIESVVSAELAPREGGFVEISLTLSSQEDILLASTKNAAKIRAQISILFDKLHGTQRPANSHEVTKVYELFAAALLVQRESDRSEWDFERCDILSDGYFLKDVLTPEQLAEVRFPLEEFDRYSIAWEVLGPIQNELLLDPLSSKYAWTVVMVYMLTHYDYLHE